MEGKRGGVQDWAWPEGQLPGQRLWRVGDSGSANPGTKVLGRWHYSWPRRLATVRCGAWGAQKSQRPHCGDPRGAACWLAGRQADVLVKAEEFSGRPRPPWFDLWKDTTGLFFLMLCSPVWGASIVSSLGCPMHNTELRACWEAGNRNEQVTKGLNYCLKRGWRWMGIFNVRNIAGITFWKHAIYLLYRN